jgi:Tfp pilus assembly protein PilF
VTFLTISQDDIIFGQVGFLKTIKRGGQCKSGEVVMRIYLVILAQVVFLALISGGCADKNAITPAFLQSVDITTISDSERLTQIGAAYLETQEYVKAIQALKKALQINPNDPAVNNALGYAYLMFSDCDKAKMYLRIAISLKKDYDDAYYNLGDVFYREGDLDEAMKNYKAAITINPGYTKKQRPFTGEPFVPLK